MLWQVKLDKGTQANEEGWSNIPHAVGSKLTEALHRNEKVLTLTSQSVQYSFDLEKNTRTTVKTGAAVELKPPGKDNWGGKQQLEK